MDNDDITMQTMAGTTHFLFFFSLFPLVLALRTKPSIHIYVPKKTEGVKRESTASTLCDIRVQIFAGNIFTWAVSAERISGRQRERERI